jgi:hypothetical protein
MSVVAGAQKISQPAASRAQSNRIQVVCQARANSGRRPRYEQLRGSSNNGEQAGVLGARAPCSAAFLLHSVEI